MTEPADPDNDPVTSRRRFLREGGALMGGAVVVGLAGSDALAATEGDNLPPNIPEWMKAPGDPMGSQLYGTPSPFEKGVVKNISKKLPQYISASGRTPLQDLDGIITPNGLFYERHHGGVPTIDPEQHRLDAAWTGGAPADLHHGRHSPLPVAIADPFSRMFRQPGLHQAVWQDRLRSGRAVELRGVDRGQPEAGVAGGRTASRSQMAGR